jgi:hypothetical protein
MKTKPKPKPFRRHPRRLDRARRGVHHDVRHTARSAVVACLDVAEERAHRDETIGKGAFGGTTLEVVDGLAAIQKLEPEGVSLWAKAPSIEIKVTRSEGVPLDWILTVENAFPDAVLEARTDSGALVPESLSSEIRTENDGDSRFPAVLRLFRFARPAVNPSPRGASPCSATFKRPSIGCRTSTRA